MPWTPPILITERLTLSAPTDNEHVRFTPDLQPERESDLPGLPSNWRVFLKSADKAIGSIGYMRWDRAAKIAEMGFILDAAHRNQGFMTEACRAVIAFGFEGMALEMVEARSFPHNLASIRVFEKAEMKCCEQVKVKISLKGGLVDLLIYRIPRISRNAKQDASE